MAARKSGAPATVEEYLERVPEPARTTLAQVRAVIQSVLPEGATEGISYGIPSYKYKGMLVGFGAFKSHCSLFVMNPDVFALLPPELQALQSSKGAIYFPVDRALPAPFLEKLVQVRVAQNEALRGLR
jgi:uncharacterized protein YdhG (YjbR/CyaY superfamily)